MRLKLILVVDADARLGYVVKEFIEDETRTIIHVVRTAAEALQFVQQIRPALILLDVNQTDPGSLDLCRRLKESSRTNTIPVVAFSPVIPRQVVLAAGCDDYLKEPFSLEQLTDVVRRWL